MMKKAKIYPERSQKIGIIGVGMVGGAVAHYFESLGKKLFLYDKYNGVGSPDEVNKADIIFVCVPTPYHKKKGFDASAVEDAFQIIKGSKKIVVKSTVLPGTTEKLQKKYPQHKNFFNPEFLSEATADWDMQHPDVQLIGYTPKSRKQANSILKILPPAPFEKIIPAKEAEMFKYFHNVHGAVKVIFGNQMYDLCKKSGVNYEHIIEYAEASKNIGTRQYLNVWHKRYRGYGGSCFPKDIRALIQFGEKIGVNLKLLKAVEEINNQLLKKQKIKNPEKL